MNHPETSLIDYVDGTLAPDARAAVEAHLQVCPRCRADVRLASQGHAAAAGLPQVEPPVGLASEATAEAERLAAARAPAVASIDSTRPSRARPAASRWLSVAGVAAAIVMIAIVAPKLGQVGRGTSAESAAGAGADAGPTFPPATAVEIQDADYGVDDLAATADAVRAAAFEAAGLPGASTSTEADASVAAGSAPPATGAATTLRLAPQRLAPATKCLSTAWDRPEGELTRVILARYEGRPAYFGFYVVRPAPDLPPFALQIYVTSVPGCEPLSTSTARL